MVSFLHKRLGRDVFFDVQMDVGMDNEKSPQRFSLQAFLKPPVTQYNYTFRPCLSISEHKFFGPTEQTPGRDRVVKKRKIEKPDPRVQHLASEEGDELVIISSLIKAIVSELLLLSIMPSVLYIMFIIFFKINIYLCLRRISFIYNNLQNIYITLSRYSSFFSLQNPCEFL
jgi:hypothetical protein